MAEVRRRIFQRGRGGGGGGGSGDDIEAPAWVQAVLANGGQVTAQRLMVVSRFIAAEKRAGTWDLTDDYWALWGENAVQALTSLKQRRLATAVAAPVFTADQGYVTDGVASYINTNFVPSTHALAMTGTNVRFAVYERTNSGALSAVAMGMNSGAMIIQMVPLHSSNTLSWRPNANASTTFTLPVVTSLGYSAASRNGPDSTNNLAFRNGVSLTILGNPATVWTSTLLPVAVPIGCNLAAGGPSSPRAISAGFACVGAALTPAQELAQYTNVQAWATAVGANV